MLNLFKGKKEGETPLKVSLDVNEVQTVDYATLELINPKTGQLSGSTITLYSHLSKEFYRAKKEVLKLNGGLDESFYQTELLTRVTKEINGFMENGKPLESNEENIRKLYQSLYIRDEADTFLSNINNFFLNK